MSPQECATALSALLAESLDSVRQREATEFDRRLSRHPGRVVLFGAGNMGRRLLRKLRESGLEPLAFTDNGEHTWGTTIDGLTVYPPTEAPKRFGGSANFVVTIWNPSHRFRETEVRLTRLGCDSVIPLPVAHWKYHDEFLPFFWADLPHKLLAHRSDILRAVNLWADDFSRREFVEQIRWRMSGDLGGIADPVPEASYFPTDLFHLKPDEVFVDCGAFDGCTVAEYLARSQHQFAHITALEPDPANFAKLTEFVKSHPGAIASRIEAIPAAVGRERTRLRFNADGTMGAGFSPTGTIEVDCTTLDHLAKKRVPTYVKMDIEGAEPGALAGGRNLIATHRPILAVCLYHELTHLWSLPLQVEALVPGGYRFFLRPHEPEGWQIVLYAVPSERLLH